MTTDLAKARESILGTIAPAGGPAWLRTLREGAFARFKTQGFPTPKNERWKYTDLSLYWPGEPPHAGKPVKTEPLARLKTQGFDVEKGHWLVFVDGIHSPGQSSARPLPAGLRAGSLASMLEDPSVRETLGRIAAPESDALTALNLAAFQDGAFLQVAEGMEVAGTIHLVFVSTQPVPAFARNLVLVGDNSRLSLVEHFLEDTAGPSLFSSVTEVKLAPGARVDHVKIQQGSTGQLHFGTVQARQEAGSHFASRVFSFGGRLVRNETGTLLADKRAQTILDGLFLGRGREHLDNQTFIDHASPQCSCQESYQGVLEGEATGVFDGRVLVRENAQKTDARQSNKNLLLSKTAKVYSKPQLQIYADDVKCSHGSATGQLDEAALFYLRARGIGRAEARRILVSAFAGELVARLEDPALRRGVEKLFQNWFDRSGAAHDA